MQTQTHHSGTCYRPEDLYAGEGRLLPISRALAYELLKSGVIPNIRLGKKYIIPKVAFHGWLDSTHGLVAGAGGSK